MNGTDFRLFYEKYAIFKLAEYLNIRPDEIEHTSEINMNAPYDIKYKGQKYDVKFAIPTLTSKSKRQTIWDFDLHKMINGDRVGHFGIDFFICVGMLKGIPNSLFLIPANIAPKRHLRISITGTSKWHQYKLTSSTKIYT